MPSLPVSRCLAAVRRAGFLLVLGWLACAAQAQIVFTITAAPYSLREGYTPGNYTFVFTLGSSTTAHPGTFTSTSNGWYQEETSHPAIFTAISGSGLNGSYVPPSSPSGAPSFYLTAQNNGSVNAFAGNDNDDSLGFTTPNGTGIGVVNWSVSGLTFLTTANYTGSYVAPDVFWASHLGTYTGANFDFSSGSISLLNSVSDGTQLAAFGISSITISGSSISAVPEPATCAIVAGFGALAVACYRRRRQSSQRQT